MGYILSRKLRLQAQLSTVQTQLENLYSSFTDISSTTVKSYAFDSGEGSQRTTRRDLSEIQDQIDRLEARERWLINELSSIGLVSVRLRRKHNSCRY